MGATYTRQSSAGITDGAVIEASDKKLILVDFWAPWWPGIKRWKSHTAKLAYEIGSIQHLIDDYGLNEESL